jgi:hypothetical protein
MRFFSNDAKDSADETVSDEHPERVQSDPVAVPQQRAGSPWSDPRNPADPDSSADPDAPTDSDAPADSGTHTDSDTATTDAEFADRERADGSVDSPGYGSTEPVRDDSEDRQNGDALVPSDESTTASAPAHEGLGAHRVDEDGEEVTSTDVADEQDSDRLAEHNADAERHDDDRGDDRDDVVDLPLEEPATSGDSGVQDSAVQDSADRDSAVEDSGDKDSPAPDLWVQDETIDTATDGTPADDTPVATTTTYGPDGTVTTTAGSADDEDFPTDSDDSDPAVKDEGGFDDPTAVDPATEEPLDSTPDEPAAADEPAAVDEPAEVAAVSDYSTPETAATDDDSTAGAEAVPVIVAVPVGSAADADDKSADDKSADDKSSGDKLPGSVTAPELGSLFAASDAQSFQDRWREVQLRFVDSPKEATAEAAKLVDEAVDQLTASLKAQKDQVAIENSEDTEQLRVELRGYRDILNRVLTL